VNQSLFLWLNGWVGQSAILDAVFLFGARDLIYVLVAGFLGVIWRARPTSRPRLIVVSVLGVLLAWQVIILIHQLYPHPRPQATDLPAQALVDRAIGSSLPSQHTTFAFLVATIVFCLRRRLGIAFLAGATIIGLFRVVAGVHWPLDILAGAVLGIIFGYLTYLLSEE
jgi:undecaprenyl-diphosphatase